MDILKAEKTLNEYNKRTGNIYASVLAVAQDVRKHQKDNNFIPTISESMTYILEGNEPTSIQDYIAFYKRVDKIIDDDLDGVLDGVVKQYVQKSIKKSIESHKLIFVYPYNDLGINAKIRIHCRQVWHKLGFGG